MKLLVATRSKHKMSEIRAILGDVAGIQLLDLDAAGVAPTAAEEGLEPFDTFEENARSKAEYFHALTGLPTVADDSGLEVDALGGAPGVRSKRFSARKGIEGDALDAANNRHLVRLLSAVPTEERTARYVCVAVLVEAGKVSLVCRGEAAGLIVDEPSGSGGFGYDPHVLDPAFGGTFADMTAAEKNGRSHRGKAFRAVRAALLEREP